MPDSAAGPVPDVQLGYSSGLIDGFNTNSNGQVGPVGTGWSLGAGGVITRRWDRCATTGNLCDDGDLDYWLTLRGRSSKLVRVGSTNVFRLADDPFWRIERKFTASGNGDSEGEWWEVRTGDGTVYEFGRNARSLSRVLVYSAVSVCPGGFAFHLCQKGWEWNLDVVRDGNGNEVRYRYEPEKNYFTPELVPGFASPVPVQYDRASQLRSITYTRGTQSPNARVVFDWELRCGDVDTYGTCSIFGIDAPWDLWCRTPSTNCRLSPSFWSGARLGSIVTQVRDGAGGWTTRAVHDLVQSQPAPPNDTAASSGARTMLYRIHRRPGGRFERFGFDQMPVVEGTIAAGTPVRAHNGEDLDSESYAKFKVGDRIRLDDVYLGEPAARASARSRSATRRSAATAPRTRMRSRSFRGRRCWPPWR